MRLTSQTEIKTIESPDELQFVIETEDGVPGLIFMILVAGGILGAAFANHQYWLILLGCGALGSWGLHSLSNPKSVRLLFVNSRSLHCRKGGDLFPNEVVVSSHDLKTLSYSHGGEHDPTGLYAYCFQKQLCVVEGLGREDTEKILAKIRRKFPDLEQGDRSPASLLYNNENEIISLKL